MVIMKRAATNGAIWRVLADAGHAFDFRFQDHKITRSVFKWWPRHVYRLRHGQVGQRFRLQRNQVSRLPNLTGCRINDGVSLSGTWMSRQWQPDAVAARTLGKDLAVRRSVAEE